MVDAVLDVAVDECLEVIDGIVDSVVSDAPLREIVSANLGRSVAGRDEGLASGRDVIHILLMFAVVDVCAQAA